MRTIDECKAEVFRRMENGIKERKRKRNCFIAACAPLCICVMVFTVMLLPNMLPIHESADNAANEMEADRTEGDQQLLFTSVEIVNSSYPTEKHTVSTDAEQVDMLYKSIVDLLYEHLYTANTEGAVAPEDMSASAAAENVTVTANIAHPRYTITFCSSYGDTIVYEINGNSLICRTADDETVLTQGELMELLGKLTSLFDGKENAE